MSPKPLVFLGVDTGLDGAFASLTVTAGQVTAVHLATMPTAARDDKGREVLTLATIAAVRQVAPAGWTRCLVERPVRGGMGHQGMGVEFAQGDAHGVVRAVLDLEARDRDCTPPEAIGVMGWDGWHGQLAMQSARDAGVDRKTLSINVAESLLALLADHGATVHGLGPCRGYKGLIGGQAAPRSGAADALLIAWLAYRLWLGVPAGAPTQSLDTTWQPPPKEPKPRVRKSPHTPPPAAPHPEGSTVLCVDLETDE